jgi:hypothetical protein
LPSATNVTVSAAVGAAGAQAGNAAPEASFARLVDGTALTLAGGEAVALPGSTDDDAGGVDVHADSVIVAASQIAARDLRTTLPTPQHLV